MVASTTDAAAAADRFAGGRCETSGGLRTRGFRIGADGSISIYAGSPRLRPPAAKQEGSPMPPKRESRSDQGSKRAANARTRRSAERAAKHTRYA